MLYALTDASGAILRIEDLPAPPPVLAAAKGWQWLPVADERAVPADGETVDPPRFKVETGRVVRIFPPRSQTYAERLAACREARRAADPPVGDQLDAAYKARGGHPDDQAAIDAAIAAVKAAFPKPEPD